MQSERLIADTLRDQIQKSLEEKGKCSFWDLLGLEEVKIR